MCFSPASSEFLVGITVIKIASATQFILLTKVFYCTIVKLTYQQLMYLVLFSSVY